MSKDKQKSFYLSHSEGIGEGVIYHLRSQSGLVELEVRLYPRESGIYLVIGESGRMLEEEEVADILSEVAERIREDKRREFLQ